MNYIITLYLIPYQCSILRGNYLITATFKYVTLKCTLMAATLSTIDFRRQNLTSVDVRLKLHVFAHCLYLPYISENIMPSSFLCTE